jgi:5-methylcytosine-specific restriction endonuclease McrA
VEWRKSVFARDDYTCQRCGVKGGRLEAHHIKAYKPYPQLRHVLSNGMTLCKPCHSKTDTYGWQNYWKNQIAAKRLSQEVFDFTELSA